jgi:hypothetical protein
MPLLFAIVYDRYKDCNGVVSDGCETSVNDDTNNCGACNTPAAPFPNAAPACVDGASVLGTCNPGWVLDACPIFCLLLLSNPNRKVMPSSTVGPIKQTSRLSSSHFVSRFMLGHGC